MKKKKVVCIFLILICSVLAFIISCHYKYKNEPETEIRVISQRHSMLYGAYEYDGELYRSTSNGIYKYVENGGNVEIIKVDSDYFNFTISNEKIYIVSSDEKNAFLSIYSMSGNLLDKHELPVEYLSGIGIVDNYLIGDISTEKGKYIFKVFDIENELTEVDIKLTECIYYSKTHYSYGEEYISAALDDKSYFICNNGYIKSSSEEYLAANEKYLAYTYGIVEPSINYIDTTTGENKNIPYYKLNRISKIILTNLKDDNLTIASTDYKNPDRYPRSLFDTDLIKYHWADSYSVIDLKSGKVLKKHKFKKHERIIFIDDEKIVTYKDGKVITYSTDDFSKIDEQKYSGIVNDEKYILYVGNSTIFVLDHAAETLLDTIPIN